MARTPENRDWAVKRNIGRREADRSVCVWHDQCHETVADIRMSIIDHLESNAGEFDRMEKSIKTQGNSKLDWKVFALFVGGVITIGVAFLVFVIPLFITMSETVSRIDANQVHLMNEFNIAVKK